MQSAIAMSDRRGLSGPVKPAEKPAGPTEASGGIAAKVRQVKQRLFSPRTAALMAAKASTDAPNNRQGFLAKLELPRRSVSFQASLAEFFLVNRLRARSQQSKQAAEILERASHIVFVTCKHWFAEEDQKPGRHETRI